jgi:hypothetical protein
MFLVNRQIIFTVSEYVRAKSKIGQEKIDRLAIIYIVFFISIITVVIRSSRNNSYFTTKIIMLFKQSNEKNVSFYLFNS